MGTNKIINVELSPDDLLYILFEKLNICDKNTKFLFNGTTYSMGTILTFREIGFIKDSRININNQAISGGGGEDVNRFANLSEEFIRKDDVSKNDPNIP